LSAPPRALAEHAVIQVARSRQCKCRRVVTDRTTFNAINAVAAARDSKQVATVVVVVDVVDGVSRVAIRDFEMVRNELILPFQRHGRLTLCFHSHLTPVRCVLSINVD
jgi:hypothetical protein